MIGLSWLLLALAGGVQATEFQLDTDTPDSLCPELSMTREAVRQRLGQLETEAGGRWRGVYSNVHDPTGRHGDYVRLVIRDAEGREQLKRELPLKGESCETLAQAIALVVDGYFRELAQTPARDDATEKPRSIDPGGSSHDPQPRTPTSEPAITPSTGTPEPAEPTQRVPQQQRRPKIGFALAGSYESAPSTAAATFGVSVALPTHWQWQLRAGFPFSMAQESRGQATASGYAIPTRLSMTYAFDLSKGVQWMLGPEVLLSLERARSQGVRQERTGWRASPGLGARTSVAFWVSQSIAFTLDVSADAVLFQSRRFLMYDQPVLEYSRARISANAGLLAEF